MKCERCGALLPSASRFCLVCGNRIAVDIDDEDLEGKEPVEKIEPETIAADIVAAVSVVRQKQEEEMRERERLFAEYIKGRAESQAAEVEEGSDPQPENNEETKDASIKPEKADDTTENAADGSEESCGEVSEEETDGTENNEDYDEEEYPEYPFESLCTQLVDIAGSGAMLLVAIISLVTKGLTIVQGVYANIVNNAGLDAFTVSSDFISAVLVVIVAVSLLVIYNTSRRESAYISTGALGTMRVIAFIRAAFMALGIVVTVCAGTFLLIVFAVGIPLIPFLPLNGMTVTILLIIMALLAAGFILALIYYIKQAAFFKQVKNIWQGITDRIRTGYLCFITWVVTVSKFITALLFAALIFSGSFVVSLVRSFGFTVAAETEATTLKAAPVLFGVAALISLAGAIKGVAAARVYRRASDAMKEYENTADETRE